MNLISRLNLSLACCFLFFVLSGCSTAGSNLEIDIKKIRITQQPSGFQSSLIAFNQLNSVLLKEKPNRNDYNYVVSQMKLLHQEQEAIQAELKTTGQLILKPGHSYEFDLESFCIDSGSSQPVIGDELYILPNAISPSWLISILSNYKRKNLSQKDTQLLIWSLMAGLKFNELNSNNQNNLLKLFPDARIRFGNSKLDEKMSEVLEEKIPQQAREIKNQLSAYKELLQKTNIHYTEIESKLSPRSRRENAFPVGWIETSQGYYIKLTAQGYQETNVKIYVPENLKT